MPRDDYNFSLTDGHIASNNLLLYINFPAFMLPCRIMKFHCFSAKVVGEMVGEIWK